MTLQAMPDQLILGRDMVLNVQHLTDWTAIKARKQQIIRKNNRIENSKQIPHHYQVGNLVMLENNRANKYEQPDCRPYRITQVNTNGTVHLKINAVTDTVNI
jgi:FPC/CPF motif-containing protein YcgG